MNTPKATDFWFVRIRKHAIEWIEWLLVRRQLTIDDSQSTQKTSRRAEFEIQSFQVGNEKLIFSIV